MRSSADCGSMRSASHSPDARCDSAAPASANAAQLNAARRRHGVNPTTPADSSAAVVHPACAASAAQSPNKMPDSSDSPPVTRRDRC
jgi:hypothetical protein